MELAEIQQIIGLYSDPTMVMDGHGTILIANKEAHTRLESGADTADQNASLFDCVSDSRESIEQFIRTCKRSSGHSKGRIKLKHELEAESTVCIGSVIKRDPDPANTWIIVRCTSTTSTNTNFPILTKKIDELSLEIQNRKDAETQASLLLKSTGEAIYGLDLEGNCTFCNPACLRILHFTNEDELLGKNMHELIHYAHADGTLYPVHECKIFKAFQEQKGTRVDNEVLWRSDGTSFHSEYWSYPIFQDGNIIGSVVTFIDITERKKAKLLIENSLAEKEVLLKEIHHRVKNNLQIISSLLNLQSAKIDDEEVQSMFMESQSRVTAMALIHEKLYRSDDLAGINFAEYLQSLVDSLAKSYASPYQSIRIDVTVEDISLEIDTAIPCALIVNELVSNALKHAFPHDALPREDQNRIHVEMSCGDNDEIVLSVSDNGCGFPDDLDFKNSDSLGMQIVDTLTTQLDGTIELNNNSGAIFTARFTEIKQETVVGIS